MKKRKGQGKKQKGEVKREKVQGIPGQGRAPGRVRLRRLPRVPPPDSNVWPPEYRGERWRPMYAILFAGHCQLCAYSCPLPRSRQIRDQLMGVHRLLLCTNHPDSPGELREVLPTGTCRNFKAVAWQPRRVKAGQDTRCPTILGPGRGVRRIAVGHGLFATVDARDYKEISKYKWYLFCYGRNTYAVCHTKGKTVYMHRMIMRPRKGYVVDHIDGNGLNNRRCNLRVCTAAQNRANAGPRGGSSRFVGVYRRRDKWVAAISCRGRDFYLGTFDDEVEAAKARDRKAYELHGPYAYLNFPEDFRR